MSLHRPPLGHSVRSLSRQQEKCDHLDGLQSTMVRIGEKKYRCKKCGKTFIAEDPVIIE